MLTFLKVKTNEDFLFKLSIIITIFLFIYFLIFVLQNYNYLFPNKEGYDNNDNNNDNNNNNNNNNNNDNNDNDEPTFNENKKDLIKMVNNDFSNDNRAKSSDIINWYRTYNKALILEIIKEGSINQQQQNASYLNARLQIEKAYKDGSIDEIMSTFPLTESETSNNTSSTSYY